MKSRKSQSAIEYLTTYGWAILVIAIVVGLLYQLGAFGNGNLAPRAQPGACSISRTSVGTSQIVSLTGICNGELPQYAAVFTPSSNSYVLISSELNNNLPSYTLNMWVYPVVTPSGMQLFGEGTGTCSTYNTLTNPLTIAAWNQATAGNWETSTSNVAITKGFWHMVTITLAHGASGAGNIIVYVNGTFANSITNSQNVSVTGASLSSAIGGLYTCSSIIGTFNGMISNFQLYNTTLTANDVRSLYIEGIGGAPLIPIDVLAWLPLNGNGNDYSGYGNNGAVSNTLFTSQWQNGYTTP